MKIKTSPGHLKIEDNHWILKGFAITLFSVGCFLLTMFNQSYQLVCHVKQPGIAKQCTISHPITDLWTKITIPELLQAKIYRYSSRNGKTNYKLQMQTSYGRQILPMISTPKPDRLLTAVSRLNQYIRHSYEPTFTIPGMYPWYVYGFVLIFPAAGIIIFIYTGTSCIRFSRTLNYMEISHRRLWQPSANRYSIEDIAYFTIASNPSGRSNTFRIECYLKDGRIAPFSSFYDSLLQKKQKVLKALSSFGFQTR